MQVEVEIVIQQESGYIARTPRGYIGILGETQAGETETITIALPANYRGVPTEKEACQNFCDAIRQAGELGTYPYTKEYEPE